MTEFHAGDVVIVDGWGYGTIINGPYEKNLSDDPRHGVSETVYDVRIHSSHQIQNCTPKRMKLAKYFL